MRLLNDIWFYNVYFPLRNIWRNRRRTIITVLSIATGSFSMLMFFGYIEVMNAGLKDEAIHKDFGHIQIAMKGFFEDDETSIKHMMNEKQMKLLIDSITPWQEVESINYRLHYAGLIGANERSTIFTALAGDPESEIFMLPQLIEGEPYTDKSNEIIIGNGLAKKLGCKLNSELVLMGSNIWGGQEAISVSVKGIYHGIIPAIENMQIYMPITAGWDLMGEKSIHRLLILLKNENDVHLIKTRIEMLIKKTGYDLEVRDWTQLSVFYQQIIGMFRGIGFVVGAIIFLIITFNISNTMYMIINDRISEIGTLRAIGRNRTEICVLLLTEGFYMSLIGSIIGVVAAVFLVPIINGLHLTLPPPPGQIDRMPIFIQLSFIMNAIVIGTCIFIGVLATIMPAIKTSRLAIIDALRQN